MPGAPPRPAAPPAEHPAETTTRLRPLTAPAPEPRTAPPAPPSGPSGAASRHSAPGTAYSPYPAYAWDAPATPPASADGGAHGTRPRPRLPRPAPRTVTAAACLVLGVGLIGGALTGSWLSGDGDGTASTTGFRAAGDLWHSVPVDHLFPPTVNGDGAGPGGADRTWTRIAVAPDSGCTGAFDPLLARTLTPVGCRRLLRATYTDATQTYVTTVGLLFTRADPAAMTALARRFGTERLDRRADLMPRPYAAKGTAAARFGDRQRAVWTVSVLTDAPVVVFAVSGWADGRAVDAPEPVADAVRSGATGTLAQAGIGDEARGLADRVARRLRQTVSPATESPS
ncbi:hypothetical protein KUM39_15990 [Streptomyces sp. J2-1]|nr:hypothetical protein [Streptomyces corallincola]